MAFISDGAGGELSSAVRRRRRQLEEDGGGVSGSPFVTPSATTSDAMTGATATGALDDLLQGARAYVSPTGRITLAPDVTEEEARQLGQTIGLSQVRGRLATQPGAYATAEGGAAQLGTGAGLQTPFTFLPAIMRGGPSIDDRMRDVQNAVKRRLEELTGAVPGQPQFRSPLTRGRFGT